MFVRVCYQLPDAPPPPKLPPPPLKLSELELELALELLESNQSNALLLEPASRSTLVSRLAESPLATTGESLPLRHWVRNPNNGTPTNTR